MTTLAEYLAIPESKYAVITAAAWAESETAQALAPMPRLFDYNGTSMAIISLDQTQVPALAEAYPCEFGQVTIGSGRVTLLTHSQILAILPEETEHGV
jgi:hypothetical protein